jgi:hypothetical protein
MPKQTNAVDEQQFLTELTKLEGSTRNVVLREALKWGEPHYRHVRQRLIDDELVEIRPGGPGGYVCLKDKASDKQKPPTGPIKSVSSDQRENTEASQKVGPLRFEAVYSANTSVEVVLNNLRDGGLMIPNYQGVAINGIKKRNRYLLNP